MKNCNDISLCMDYVEKIQTRQLVLFGGGGAAHCIIAKYYSFDGEVVKIWDNNPEKWGRKFLGVPILKPEISEGEHENLVVIITIDDETAVREVKTQLEKLGVIHVYHFSVLSPINVLGRFNRNYSRLWHELNTYSSMKTNANELQQVRNLLYDDKSRFIYDNVIQKRKYNLHDYSDVCDNGDDHYFQTGIFSYTDNEIFVDGGAYLGENTIQLTRIIGDKLVRAYCFEPDEMNYAKMINNLNGLHEKGKSITNNDVYKSDKFYAYKAGLYNVNENIGFMSTGSVFSAIEINGQEKISVVKLDDVVEKEDRVTLIKLDIEGTELAALQGAEQIIKEHKPKLAISIYHKLVDYWEIPLYIYSLVPEYKLFVRHQSTNLSDTILYATL